MDAYQFSKGGQRDLILGRCIQIKNNGLILGQRQLRWPSIELASCIG